MDAFTNLGSAFVSTALDGEDIRVISVTGVERIGQLYEFRVRFRHDAGRLTESEIDDLLLAPCTLRLANGSDPIHGIASSVEFMSAPEAATAVYEVTLVPTVWLCTISKLSHLYQAMSVKDMATEVLTRYSLGAGNHFDLLIDGAPRELAIQYHESDWDYLQRWFEHEGFSYWFEHSADGEKLIVADAKGAAKPISGGDTKLTFRERAGLGRDQESVFEWSGLQKRIPARVVLKDYNYEKPAVATVGQAVVDKKLGFGVYFEYGDNFDTPAAGNALAKKRAERFLADQRTYRGTTDCARLHVGHTFELTDHPDDAQNRAYLITAIEHSVGGIAEGGADGYRARFEAIPASVQYRPARVTPWPEVHGLMHGHIDSDSSGKFSTLDAQGRYRVRFPFDNAGKTGEKSSTWVRLAQSYAGSGYGSHYTLHKGTEVIVAFLDGDPDRPIIVGSIPNAQTPGPSAAANATQSSIKTASGIHITLDNSVTG